MSTLTAGGSSIQGTIDVRTLFERRFVIPAYQRPFDWGQKEITDLLGDLYEHATASSVPIDDVPDYLLNSILTLDTGSELQLIDGQQRITALTLLFAAARDVGKALELLTESYLHTLEALIAVKDGDIVQPRLRDQYPTGPAQEFLNQLAMRAPDGVNRDSSSYPLYRGYEQIVHWLRKQFVSAESKGSLTLTKFLDVVRKKARFAEIRVSQSAVGWRSFERANDRGKPLCIADRVKSDLFNRATSDKERAEVAESWRAMLEALRSCGTSADVFLHHLYLADFADAKVTRTAVRGLFKKLLDDHVYTAPDMARHLSEAAQAYSRILETKIPKTGEVCFPLSDLCRVQRFRRVVQARPALLAARSFCPSAFNGIAAELERLIVVVVLTEQRGQDYEKKLFDLARFLREEGETATVVSEFKTRVDNALAPMRTDLATLLGSATADSLDRDAVQYLLARVEMFLRMKSNPAAQRFGIGTLVGGANHIEHILPQSLSQASVEEFGSAGDAERFVQALGNLTIWEGSQNSALKDSPFSQKRSEYASSEHKITKALAGAQGSAGGNKEVAKRLSPVSTWTPAALERRHRELGSIVGEVLLGHPLSVPCSISEEPTTPTAVPNFPSASHLPVVLAGVNSGLRTPTDLLSTVNGVSTTGVIHQALSSLKYLDLVVDQDAMWDLTELGQVVCSESEDRWPLEIAQLVESNYSIRRCAETVGPESSEKVRRAAKAFEWARSILSPAGAPSDLFSPDISDK